MKLTGISQFVLLVALAFSCYAQENAPVQRGERVLLIYSYHPTFVTTSKILQGIESVLGPYQVELDIEFMDSKRHSDQVFEDKFFQVLSYKFERIAPYDVVMTSDDHALKFVIKHQDTLFKNTPVVFLGVNSVDLATSMDRKPYITGVIEDITIKDTIGLVKQLNPGLKKVVAVADGTVSGMGDIAKLENVVPELSRLDVEILSLGTLTWDELAKKLEVLSADSVVLRMAAFRDRDGVYFSHTEMIKLLIDQSPVPVFGLRGHDVFAGAVGGNVVSFYEQGRQAGLMVRQILQGTPVNTIPVLRKSPNKNIFNYHELQKLGIDENNLPQNSIVAGKPINLLERYKEYVGLALAIIFTLSMFVVFLLMEIKAKKRAEKELKQHQDHLEEEVEKRTKELMSANKELESFSYSVSHDLRAPLRGIDGFSQILLEEYSAALDDNGRKLLRRVRDAAQHMSDLIDDILELSRVSRKALSKQKFNLSELANDIVAKYKLLEPERVVEISVQDNLNVVADKHLLEIAINNLFDNAWKYTGKTESANISFGSEKAAGNGRLFYVKDNGTGFDMKYADKLFGAFQRLHAKNEYPGTGIGLASVHRVINRHGGRVWAEGELGKGATFYFTLPG